MAIDGPESGVVVRGLLATAAAVHLVGVRAACGATVTFSATDRAPHGEPQTCLRRFARMRAIFAGARVVSPGRVIDYPPSVGGFPAAPLWKGAVDGVPGFGVDEAAVCRGCDDKTQESASQDRSHCAARFDCAKIALEDLFREFEVSVTF